MLHWNITDKDLCRVDEGLQKEPYSSFCSPSLRAKVVHPGKPFDILAFTGYDTAAPY